MWRYAQTLEWEEQGDQFEEAEAAGAQGIRFIRDAGFHFASGLEFERALPYLETALDASGGGDYEVRATLMGSLVILDRADEALPLAEEITDGQTSPTTLGEMAFIAWQAGDSDLAREWANRARALSSEAYEATWVLAWIIAEEDGDFDTALEYLEEIESVLDVDFYPRYMHGLFGYGLPVDRGRLLIRAERYEEALEVYDSVLENDPYEAQWYAERGDVHLVLGNTEEARADYRRAADIAFEIGNTEFGNDLLESIAELGPAASDDE